MKIVNPAKWRCEHRHTGLEHPLCWQKFLENNGDDLRVGYFDIETSNLSADFGWVISWCIKERAVDHFDGYVLRRRDYHGDTRDKKAILELIKTLGEYDKIVTYYGSKFDVPFVRTRALIHGFQFIPPKTKLHLDLYYHVRGKLKLSHNRLVNAGEALGLPTEKTRVSTKVWSNVGLSFDKKALDYVWDHNKKDTVLLEELHRTLEPYIPPRRAYL